MRTVRVIPENVVPLGTEGPASREYGCFDYDCQIARLSNVLIIRLYMGDLVRVLSWRSTSKDKKPRGWINLRLEGA